MVGRKVFIAALLIGQGMAAEREMGVVKQVNLSSREIVVVLDGGAERRVALSARTPILRIAPGQKDLANAETLALDELSAGDRVLLRRETDGIVIISRTDLASRHDAQRAEWRSKGLVGTVLNVDLERREITVRCPSLSPAGSVRLSVPPEATQMRYRAGSSKFSEAQASQLRDIQPGDQVHALAERRSGNDVLIAGTVVSGYFRNFAALVTAVDPTEGTIAVRDLERNVPVLVRVLPDTALRQITAEAAQRLNTRSRPSTPAGAAGTDEPIDVRSILEGLPTFALSGLKKGDALIVATAGKGSRVAALTLLNGAEPLLSESVESGALGEWDLSLEPREE